MSRTDRFKLIAAETLARLAVYGPIGWAAVTFLGPITILPLVLSAAQPWVGEAFSKLGAGLAPHLPKEVNWLLGRIGGAKWYTHFATFAALLLGATIPLPGPLDRPLLQTIGGYLGGLGNLWGIAVNAALLTALPAASLLATNGFQRVFEVVDRYLNLGLAELHDVYVRQPAQAIRDASAFGRGAKPPAGPAPGVRSVAVASRPVTPTAPMTAPTSSAPPSPTAVSHPSTPAIKSSMPPRHIPYVGQRRPSSSAPERALV